MIETHARRTSFGQKHHLAFVVFDNYNVTAKCKVSEHVHWSDAFRYLRATGNRVKGVTFTNGKGHYGTGIECFAKWTRDRKGMYHIEVGCYSGTSYLDEHEGPNCPCSYEPANTRACSLHNPALIAIALSRKALDKVTSPTQKEITP